MCDTTRIDRALIAEDEDMELDERGDEVRSSEEEEGKEAEGNVDDDNDINAEEGCPTAYKMNQASLIHGTFTYTPSL